MRTRSILAVAAVLGGALAAGSIASAAQEAKQLVLQKSDFPKSAAARVTIQGRTPGGGGFATFAYQTGSAPNELSVSVAVVPTRAMAVALFNEFKSDVPAIVRRIQLPKYGDEQFAYFHVAQGSSLVVRKNAVVWAFELQTFLTRGGKTHELTMAEAIAEYKRYAPKQKRRVGAG